jgi:hypothetical protein
VHGPYTIPGLEDDGRRRRVGEEIRHILDTKDLHPHGQPVLRHWHGSGHSTDGLRFVTLSVSQALRDMFDTRHSPDLSHRNPGGLAFRDLMQSYHALRPLRCYDVMSRWLCHTPCVRRQRTLSYRPARISNNYTTKHPSTSTGIPQFPGRNTIFFPTRRVVSTDLCRRLSTRVLRVCALGPRLWGNKRDGVSTLKTGGGSALC